MQHPKKSKAEKSRLDQRITVCFSREEMDAIARKAAASGLKPSSTVRILALKSIGAIQMQLFSQG